MGMTEKELGQVHPADTNNATVYTAPASTTAVAISIRVSNVTTAEHTFRLFKVSSGDSVGVANSVYYDYIVPANGTFSDDGKHVLETGGTWVFRSDTANAFTCTISGYEVT